MSFLDAIKSFFTRYAEFQGRSRRSEYWFAYLFTGIVSGVITAIIPALGGVWSLATLVPSIAITIRRLHDAGKSGWWILWSLLPLVGFIIVLIQLCKDSEPDNQWGPNPKA